MVESESSVWINTIFDERARRYRVAVFFDEENHVILDRESGLSYAHAVLMAASCAEYDAAIVAQMRKVMAASTEAPKEEQDMLLAQIVTEFRKRRPPVRRPLERMQWGHGKKNRANPTDVMELVPGVSALTGKAFLHIKIKGALVGQWTVTDAREHATNMLEVISVSELDQAYFETIRTLLLPESGEDVRAANMVGEIADFREGVK